MAYLFPYAGQEKAGRQKHPYYKELERQARNKERNLPAQMRLAAEPAEEPYPMPEKYSFAGMSDVPPSLRRLMVEVCKEHRVMPADLRGCDSRQHVVQARRVYCIRAKDETNCSYSKIARSIDKDHTTVIYFVKQGHSGCSMRPVAQTETPPLGVRRIRHVTKPTQLESEFMRLAEKGFSLREIADKMGKTLGAVGHYRKRLKKKAALALELEAALEKKDD